MNNGWGQELRREIFETLAEITSAQIDEQEMHRQQAQSEANSHVGAMESRYDTFKEDAQYLSAGYEARIRELTKQRTAFARWAKEVRREPRLASGALVKLRSDDGREEHVVLASSALDAKRMIDGGVEVQGNVWQLRGETSELGKTLLEKEDAYREEERQLRNEVERRDTEAQLGPVLARMRAIVCGTEGAMEAGPERRKMVRRASVVSHVIP